MHQELKHGQRRILAGLLKTATVVAVSVCSIFFVCDQTGGRR